MRRTWLSVTLASVAVQLALAFPASAGEAKGTISYKGKVWSDKYGGIVTPHMREDGDGTRSYIDVVMVKAASVLSKKYYAGGYVDGSDAKPDCFSNNGISPDASVPNKINPTCGNCPMNVRGSKISDNGNAVKACADSKRMAIVPLGDIDNESKGGPMLLNIPADSLQDTAKYGHDMSQVGFPYYAVGTRISFDPEKAHPKFVYRAVRKLTDEEAEKIVALRSDPRVASILSQNEYAAGQETQQQAAQPYAKPKEDIAARAAAEAKLKAEVDSANTIKAARETARAAKAKAEAEHDAAETVPDTQEQADAREFAAFKAAQAASRAAQAPKPATPAARPKQAVVAPVSAPPVARAKKEVAPPPVDDDMDEIDAELAEMMKM